MVYLQVIIGYCIHHFSAPMDLVKITLARFTCGYNPNFSSIQNIEAVLYACILVSFRSSKIPKTLVLHTASRLPADRKDLTPLCSPLKRHAMTSSHTPTHTLNHPIFLPYRFLPNFHPPVPFSPAPCAPPHGAGFSFTILRTFFSYAWRSFLNRLNASACAGDSGFGSSSSDWMPRRISLMVMAGFQPSSSLRMERQTVPEG